MGLPLIYGKSRLTFPGRAPGFDLTHPAAENMAPGRGICAVPYGAGFINLLTGIKLSTSGTLPTALIGGITGSLCSFVSGAASQLTNQSGFTPTQTTFAAIIQFSTVSSNQTMISTSNSMLIQLSSGNFTLYDGTPRNSGIILSANIPYFVAASAQISTVSNFVVVNLATGQLKTAIGTIGTSFVANVATQDVGNYVGGTTQNSPGIGPAMWSPTYLSLRALTLWAQRPWDFWYPPRVEELIFNSLTTRVAAAATQRFLSIMGVGR